MKQKLNAAIVIQKHWRKYVAQIKLRKLKKAKQEAAERIASLVIQVWWLLFLPLGGKNDNAAEFLFDVPSG